MNKTGNTPSIFDSSINVHVLGAVQSPGVYSASVSNRLTDLLKMAIPKRPTVRLVQIRYPGDRTKSYDLYRYYYKGDLTQNPYLRDNVTIFIPPHKGMVRIEGPVTRSGQYELVNEKSALDVINLAGGVTSASSKINPVKVIRFSENGKKFVLNINHTLSDLKKFKIMKGDIIIVPDIINNPKSFDYTVESIPGENLFYPTSTPTVFVMGAVNAAGSYAYKSNLRAKDYVANASPTPDARLNSITLIRDGRSHKFRYDQKPQSGDILVVKSKIKFGAIVAAVSTALSLTLTTLVLREQLNN